jgi:hypothetical protein
MSRSFQDGKKWQNSSAISNTCQKPLIQKQPRIIIHHNSLGLTLHVKQQAVKSMRGTHPIH